MDMTNLDQPHEIQDWKDSRFNRSKKAVIFLRLYFKYPLVYCLRRALACLLIRTGNHFVQAGHRISPLGATFIETDDYPGRLFLTTQKR